MNGSLMANILLKNGN